MRDDMPAKSTSFIKLMSKKIIVMITLICLLMLFLMMIIFFMNQSSKDEYVLIDVFGRQRMLTQQLSKDANRKYAILQSLRNGSLIETDEALNDRTLLLNNSLAKAHNEFSNIKIPLIQNKILSAIIFSPNLAKLYHKIFKYIVFLAYRIPGKG